MRKTLGATPPPGTNSTAYSEIVNFAFDAALDWAAPTQYYIEALLDRGVRALIYVGEHDWGCNWVGCSIASHVASIKSLLYRSVTNA